MPNHQATSTQEQLNKIIAFRQAVYEHGFTQARDAQFELLDALLLSPPINSFAELSLSPVFRRQWHSVYAALARGRQDPAWVRRYLCEQVPGGLQVFALDKSVWAHPRARTLSELGYERSPSRAIEGHSIVQGHPYSLLGWVPEVGQSWALPISTERVTPACNAVDTGVAQVHALCEARSVQADADDEVVTVIAGDGSYGNHRFLGGIVPLVPAVVAVVRPRAVRTPRVVLWAWAT